MHIDIRSYDGIPRIYTEHNVGDYNGLRVYALVCPNQYLTTAGSDFALEVTVPSETAFCVAIDLGKGFFSDPVIHVGARGYTGEIALDTAYKQDRGATYIGANGGFLTRRHGLPDKDWFGWIESDESISFGITGCVPKGLLGRSGRVRLDIVFKNDDGVSPAE